MPDRVELFRRIERQHIRDQLSLLGLQSVDGLVLRLLSREGQLRQEDIVLRLVLDKGSVARSVARLEESGLAVRQVSTSAAGKSWYRRPRQAPQWQKRSRTSWMSGAGSASRALPRRSGHSMRPFSCGSWKM